MTKGTIFLVGLGPGSPELLPPGNLRVMKEADKVYLRTARHPLADYIREQGVCFESLDYLYDACNDISSVYDDITRIILDEASGGCRVAYVVPGHPFVAEDASHTISKFAADKQIPIRVFPAPSFLEAMMATLRIDPIWGLQVIDARSMRDAMPQETLGVIVAQIDSKLLMSDVKVSLLERYPPDFKVTVVKAAGVEGLERVQTMPLFEVDRIDWIDHMTSLYIPPIKKISNGLTLPGARYQIDELMGIIDQLRGEGGCPWDKEQTHESLRPYVIEEAYEVVDAINQGDVNKLCDELGDLLLQVGLHSHIAAENGYFTFNDVVRAISTKMVRRHPHVFGGAKVSSSQEVLSRWDKIKKQERTSEPSCMLGEAPRGLPALMQAYKIQQRASRLGFDWRDVKGPIEKVKEEIAELVDAHDSKNDKDLESEIGDLLFSAVNVARKVSVDPEVALAGCVQKFLRRFTQMEEIAAREGLDINRLNLQEMDELWEETKKGENRSEQG